MTESDPFLSFLRHSKSSLRRSALVGGDLLIRGIGQCPCRFHHPLNSVGDEWDDKGSPSASSSFDSTLTTESVPLPAGQDEIHVGFASHYRQDSAQKAEVTAVFDNGERVPVLGYSSAGTADNAGGDKLNEFVNKGVTVPAGATSVRLEFRMYDAGNDWFWAFDNLRISPTPISAGC